MKRRVRLAHIEKRRLFSQKEAQWLSGFSRSQLLTWEEVGIVNPEREYGILYTWDLIILLRILYHLRQRWTFQQVIKGFENSRQPVGEILEILPKSILVIFGEFGIHPDIHIEIQVHDLCNVSDNIKQKEIRNNFARSSFPFIDNTGRQTQISVPKTIEELKELAKEMEIENLDLKLG